MFKFGEMKSKAYQTGILSLVILACLCVSVWSEETLVLADAPETLESAADRIDPKGLAHYTMGLVYDWFDMSAEAISEFEKASTYDHDNYLIRLRIGADYARVGRFPEAIRELNEAARLNAEDLQAHYLLALIYSNQKEFDKAAVEYEQILKKFSQSDPQNVEIYGYLGQLYYSQQKYDKAIEQFQSILKIDPHNADVLYMLGSLYLEINDRPSAIQQFMKAIDANPQHDGSLNSLAYVYAESGENLDEALGLIKRALVINPQSGAYHDSLGWIYFKKGMYTEALESLKAADGFTKDPVIYNHLGDVYYHLREVEKAKKYWELSIELYPDQEETQEKLKSIENPLQASNPTEPQSVAQ